MTAAPAHATRSAGARDPWGPFVWSCLLALAGAPPVTAQLTASRLTDSVALFEGPLSVRSVLAADFDGDHRIEVVVIQPWWNSELWMAELGPDPSLWTGGALDDLIGVFTSPVDAAAADVDGDGHPDVLLQTSGALAAFPSEGVAGFGPPISTPNLLVSDPRQLRALDLDGDGRDDVVELDAGNGTPSLQTWTSAGLVPLVPRQTLALGVSGVGVEDMEVADLDGDGWLDVVVPENDSGRVHWTRGDGAGDFADVETLAHPALIDQTVAVEAVDFDGDGDLDVVTVSRPNSLTEWQLSRFRNAGPLGFQNLTPVPIGDPLDALAVVDVDGNGLPDLAGARPDGGLALFRGTASQSFVSAGRLPLPPLLDLLVVDVDCDGSEDIVASSVQDVWVVFGHQGGLATSQEVGLASSANPAPIWNDIASADLDGDGDGDFVVSQDQRISILGTGPGGSVQLTGEDPSSFGPRVLGLADLDLDGSPDLVLTSQWPHQVQVGTNLQPTGVGPLTTHAVTVLPRSLQIEDLDQDGDPDVVTSGPTVLRNDGGTLSPSQTYDNGLGNALGDLDEDGDPDALDSYWRLFLGDGVGGFLPGSFVPGSLPFGSWVLLGDLDLDGHLDAVGTGSVATVALGDGQGSLAELQTLPGVGDLKPRLTDLDGDGVPDLITSSTAKVLIWGGDGTGGFLDAVETLGSTGSTVLTADVDADGFEDFLFITGFDQGRLAVVPNRAAWALPFSDLAGGKPGLLGTPVLSGFGALEPLGELTLSLCNAIPVGPAHLVWGLSQLDAPFKGGVMVPLPAAILIDIPVDPDGSMVGTFEWPAGIPSGFEVYLQFWIQDVTAGFGLSASNGLRIVAP